jgi:16S rRNA A1518/A1519 N6-dimethyltransferase RsmA/KsgA/DIM1 with predicted DNA glycosylase/AP lyase activity
MVFSLTFKKGVSLQEARDLYAFVSQLFLHRRKTILNNLSTITKDSASAKEALLSAGIDPTRRPEELSLAEFQKLRSQCHYGETCFYPFLGFMTNFLQG